MKKILLQFIILIGFSLKVDAQDCKTLNNFNSFHGIRFGQQLPDSLKKDFKFEMLNGSKDSSYMDYSISTKLLRNDLAIFIKYYKWLHFGDINFSHFSISTLPNGKVYQFDLTKIYDRDDDVSISDSTDIVKNKLPKSFIKTTEELTSLFGKMTKSEDENDILGYHLYRIWECEKYKIVLRLWYDKDGNLPKDFTLLIGFSIVDKELEKLQKLWKYKN